LLDLKIFTVEFKINDKYFNSVKFGRIKAIVGVFLCSSELTIPVKVFLKVK
jgi:hypothetical protein